MLHMIVEQKYECYFFWNDALIACISAAVNWSTAEMAFSM